MPSPLVAGVIGVNKKIGDQHPFPWVEVHWLELLIECHRRMLSNYSLNTDISTFA